MVHSSCEEYNQSFDKLLRELLVHSFAWMWNFTRIHTQYHDTSKHTKTCLRKRTRTRTTIRITIRITTRIKRERTIHQNSNNRTRTIRTRDKRQIIIIKSLTIITRTRTRIITRRWIINNINNNNNNPWYQSKTLSIPWWHWMTWPCPSQSFSSTPSPPTLAVRLSSNTWWTIVSHWALHSYCQNHWYTIWHNNWVNNRKRRRRTVVQGIHHQEESKEWE